MNEANDLKFVTRKWNIVNDQSNANYDVGNEVESFKCKAKLLENTEAQPNPNQANGVLKNTTIAVPLKYLSDFWRSREMPLINCKNGQSVLFCFLLIKLLQEHIILCL